MPASIATDRLVLVRPARAARGRDGAAVRRYRLARLRVEGGAPADAVRGSGKVGADRYDHLKRVYD